MCSSTRGVYLASACVLWFCSFSFALRTSHYPSCRTTDKCIRLTECKPYMNLIKSLRRPLSPASVQYLRRQECGFDGLFPMVCCFNPESVTNAKFFGGVDNPVKDFPTPEMPQSDVISANRPDLTPSDLSDYRLTKEKSTVSPTTTTTTEKSTTTTKFLRRRVNKLLWNVGQRKEDDVDNEKQLKNKMEAINQAFASMDYFFVRRMLDGAIKEKNSVR